ncbi:MAG: hypothetical protein OEW45_10225 [Deltaproteobacteria bacterium]|nr:hypothetical protein [Deltaproteobacteria bacterium]
MRKICKIARINPAMVKERRTHFQKGPGVRNFDDLGFSVSFVGVSAITFPYPVHGLSHVPPWVI